MSFLQSFQKILSAFIISTFALTNLFGPLPVSQAAPEISTFPSLLQIPDSLGRVTDLVQLPQSSGTLIHIQTAHGQYEVQKNIQAILNYLSENYGIKLLLLEGAGNKLRPELFRFFPKDKKLNSKIMDTLIQNAQLTGAEAFLVDTTNDIQGWGVEKAEAYKKNREAFKSVILNKDISEEFLASFYVEFEKAAAPYLHKDLKEFLHTQKSYEHEIMPLSEWLRYLKKQAERRLNLDFEQITNQKNWPILMRYFRLEKIGKEIDTAKVEKEKEDFLKDIQPLKVDAYLIEEIRENDKSTSVATPFSSRLLFERLLNQLPDNFSFKSYPNLRIFIQQQILTEELLGERLHKEMDTLTNQLLKALAKTKVEKEILAIFKDYQLLKKLLGLELSREEYERYFRPRVIASSARQKDEIATASLAGLAMTYEQLKRSVPYQEALHFYEGAIQREKWMIKNASQRMFDFKQTKAALITGGFHAQGLRQRILDSGFSYVQITPRINEISKNSRELYLQVMTGKTPIQHSKVEPPLRSDITQFKGLEPLFIQDTGRTIFQLVDQVIVSERPQQKDKLLAVAHRSELAQFFRRLSSRAEIRSGDLEGELRSELRNQQEEKRFQLHQAFKQRRIRHIFMDYDGNYSHARQKPSRRILELTNELIRQGIGIDFVSSGRGEYLKEMLEGSFAPDTQNKVLIAAEAGGDVLTLDSEGRFQRDLTRSLQVPDNEKQIATDVLEFTLGQFLTEKDISISLSKQAPEPEEPHFNLRGRNAGTALTISHDMTLKPYLAELGPRVKDEIERLWIGGHFHTKPLATISNVAVDVTFAEGGKQGWVENRMKDLRLTPQEVLVSGDSAFEGGGDEPMFRVPGVLKIYSGPSRTDLPDVSPIFYTPAEGPEGVEQALELLFEMVKTQRSELRYDEQKLAGAFEIVLYEVFKHYRTSRRSQKLAVNFFPKTYELQIYDSGLIQIIDTEPSEPANIPPVVSLNFVSAYRGKSKKPDYTYFVDVMKAQAVHIRSLAVKFKEDVMLDTSMNNVSVEDQLKDFLVKYVAAWTYHNSQLTDSSILDSTLSEVEDGKIYVSPRKRSSLHTVTLIRSEIRSALPISRVEALQRLASEINHLLTDIHWTKDRYERDEKLLVRSKGKIDLVRDLLFSYLKMTTHYERLVQRVDFAKQALKSIEEDFSLEPQPDWVETKPLLAKVKKEIILMDAPFADLQHKHQQVLSLLTGRPKQAQSGFENRKIFLDLVREIYLFRPLMGDLLNDAPSEESVVTWFIEGIHRLWFALFQWWFMLWRGRADEGLAQLEKRDLDWELQSLKMHLQRVRTKLEQYRTEGLFQIENYDRPNFIVDSEKRNFIRTMLQIRFPISKLEARKILNTLFHLDYFSILPELSKESSDPLRSEIRNHERIETEIKNLTRILFTYPKQEGLSHFVRTEILLTALFGGTIQYDTFEKNGKKKAWKKNFYPDLIGLKELEKQNLEPQQRKEVAYLIKAVKQRLHRYKIRESFYEILTVDPEYQNPFLHTFLGVSKKGTQAGVVESRLERAIKEGNFTPEDEAYIRKFNDVFQPQIQMGVVGTDQIVEPYTSRVKHNNDLGTFKGGVRFIFRWMLEDDKSFQSRFKSLIEKGANLEELRYFLRKWIKEEALPLALGMTIKAAPELPYGGAKGAVLFADVVQENGKFVSRDYDPSVRFRKSLLRSYVRSLYEAKRIGYEIDIPAPDMGSMAEDMDTMTDELLKLRIEDMQRDRTFEQLPEELKQGLRKVIETVKTEPDKGIFDELYLETVEGYLKRLREKNIPVPPLGVPLEEGLATFTSKTLKNGGSEFRAEATGYGGIFVLEKMLEKEGRGESPLQGLTAKVMGFGGVGKPAVKALIAKGALVTAISEGKGGIVYKRGGFTESEIQVLERLLSEKRNFILLNRKRSGFHIRGAGFIRSEKQFLETEADILVLAAKENTLTKDNVGDLNAAFIAELANGAITNEAYYRLLQNGKTVAIDSLANAGGVTVSHFEEQQNVRNKKWGRDEIKGKMVEKLSIAIDKVDAVRRELALADDWRTATDVFMIREVLKARNGKNQPTPRSELRFAIKNQEGNGGSWKGIQGVVIKITDGIIPLAVTLYGTEEEIDSLLEEFFKAVPGAAAVQLSAQDLRAGKFQSAGQILALQGDVLILGPELIKQGGLAFAGTVFGEKPVIAIAPNDDIIRFVEDFNQARAELKKVKVAHNVREAIQLFRLSPSRPQAFISSFESLDLAQALKNQLGDLNITRITPKMFEQTIERAELRDLITDLRTRYERLSQSA